MTTASVPVRTGQGRPARLPLPATGRLLWVELRRNAMPWILPLIAALFWFDSYRPSTGLPPLWIDRTFYSLGQGHTLVDFGIFVAGAAAWIGSRDGRRGMSDLTTATARPRWAVQLANWGATAIWSVGAYLVFTGVLIAVTARSITWGGPPWWPVAVGAAGVAAFSALGFAVGVYFPSRFAAPLAAFGAFLTLMMSSQTGFRDPAGWALILPTNSNGNYGADSGIFYPYLPDLPMARVLLLAGLTVAGAGLTGLLSTDRRLRLRWTAMAVTAAGVIAAGTAAGLAASARPGPHGVVVPALHDAASDRPIPYTPACGRGGIPVCVHPAYRAELAAVTAALSPAAREIAGLPGAPVRAVQVAATYAADQGLHLKRDAPVPAATIGGSPPVLRVPLGHLNLPGAFGANRQDFTGQLRLQYLHAFTGAGPGAGDPAQQAVQAALLRGAGVPFAAQPRMLGIDGLPPSGPPAPDGPGPAKGPVYDAARRFAALPAAARHAWLATHLAALRAGQLTLAQLP